jgi:microsomal dipeptidase-like Zn-dependent dipeptidase
VFDEDETATIKDAVASIAGVTGAVGVRVVVVGGDAAAAHAGKGKMVGG